jgi:hypothetical protein
MHRRTALARLTAAAALGPAAARRTCPGGQVEPDTRGPALSPQARRLAEHPALRAALAALEGAVSAARAVADAYGTEWSDEPTAREADLLAGFVFHFATAVESQIVGMLSPRDLPPARTPEQARRRLVAAAYEAVDACCELVARHGCTPADECWPCEQADLAAAFLLGQAQLFGDDLLGLDHVKLASARRRAALTDTPLYPHACAAVDETVKDLEREAEEALWRKELRP